MLATHLSAVLGKTMIIDNRTGAEGVICTDIVAKAPPVDWRGNRYQGRSGNAQHGPGEIAICTKAAIAAKMARETQ